MPPQINKGMITQIKLQITQTVFSLLICVITLFTGIGFFVYGQDFSSKTKKITIASPQKTLTVGEELHYTVEWLGIGVGKIILKVEEIKKIGESNCYHIIARAMPNRFLSKFYDVEYTVHTYIDTETFLTLRFEKVRRKKDKLSFVIINFDHKNLKAEYQTQGNGDTIDMSTVRSQIEASVPATIQILNGVQDLFSSLYYFRLLKLEEGKKYSINIYYDQRNWVVDVTIGDPFPRDIRKMGSFTVFEVLMLSDLNEYILGKRELQVYFTTDTRRIPIEFKLNTGLGPVCGKIQKIPQ